MNDSKTLIELIRENLITWDEINPNAVDYEEEEEEKELN
jgi:hypothetical protein